ncbi:MAG: M48 family metalloprotease [Gemmatimonadales bacterium]|nr:M48 family metalloprotease [Gemmatimonadales bacterium]
MILTDEVRYIRVPTFLLLFALGATAASAQPPYTPAKPGAAPVKAPDLTALFDAANADLNAGHAALGRKDNRAARDAYKKARNTLEKALKTDPASRRAAEGLGMVYFYEGAAGDKGSFEKASDFLQKVVDADADAINAHRFLAHAYGRQSKLRETVVYAGLTAMASQDTAIVREMNDLKRAFQDFFLGNWYEYGKYYESPGAKLTRLNPANNYQPELVLQVTPQFEQDLGARGLQAMAPTLQISQDADTKAYLQKIVDKLLAKAPGGPPFTYTVDLVESSAVNAMAFPGGRIVVNTGLLKFCESEAELVAVLSHEIAHVYAHHSARALVASGQKRLLVGTILTAARIDNSNFKEQLLTLGVSAGLELLDRGYSRGEEKEADKYGTHIAFNAGYNPTFMTKFFLRLYEANPKQPFKLLSTHPPTTERIEYTSAYLETFPLETEMQIDSQEFKTMKSRLK